MTDEFSGWLYEAGIGENRAALIQGSELVRARIEREIFGARVGALVDAQFSKQWVAGRSGIVTLPGGQEALLQPLPKGLTEGAVVRVEVVREAISEKQGQSKRAKVRVVSSDIELKVGLTLLQELEVSEQPVRQAHSHENDILGQYSWHEAIEQADTGRIEFEGGSLLISVTPAMTVIDVDGPLPAVELAKLAAKEVARSIVRLNISGNIGVDFPTLEAKTERNAVAQIFDDNMIDNCERTAINGFGFMQIINRKGRPSVMEILQSNRSTNLALQLLRQAERDRGTGQIQLTAHPAIANRLKPEWLDELAKRTGRTVTVEKVGNLPLDDGQIGAT